MFTRSSKGFTMCRIPCGFSAEQFTFTARQILHVANFKRFLREAGFLISSAECDVIHV